MQFKATDKTVDWEAVSVSTNSQNLIKDIETRLNEEEWITSQWSPIHLKNILTQWYFKDDTPDVSALKVYQDTCHYLYLPRLVNDQVYKDAISLGLDSEDYFGFASGKDGDSYLGFQFGNGGLPMLDNHSVLIEKVAAENYREKIKPAPQPVVEPQVPSNGGNDYPVTNGGTPGATETQQPQTVGTGETPSTLTVAKTDFYGTLNLNPIKAKMDFAMIMDEVVQQFTAKFGVEVTISVEIQAKSKDGFDEALQRTIKENCNVLGFSSAEFEEE